MTYSIGQAAEMMNLSAYTLRYYDKEGLLPMVGRTSSGVRQFKDSDIDWLKLIECLKASGLSIKEIKQYIDWSLEGDSTLEQRRQLFYDRKKAIEDQMEQLQRTLDTITYKCWFYDTAVAAGTANVPANTDPSDMPANIRRCLKNSGLK